MKTVVIDRKYWGMERLRNSDGMRCCLGFVCEAYGVKPEHTKEYCLPASLTCINGIDLSNLPSWLINDEGSTDVNAAININDDRKLSWDEKEDRLKPIFAERGILLVFEGER